MKRVLHVWQSNYPWEVRVGKINRALLAAGRDVSVVARWKNGEAEVEVRDGVTIRRIGAGFPRPLSTPVPGNPVWAFGLERAAAEERPDLVLVRDIPLALAAARAARKRGVPVVLDMAEHYPEAMRSWRKYSENPILRRIVHDWRIPDRVEAAVVRRMDAIVVVCDEQKERLVREYGYPAEKICVAMNTPELSQWASAQKGTVRAKPKTFGYVGILCEDRDLETVLSGFDLLARTEPDVELLIAGGGESEELLRGMARGLASSNRIRFTGRYAPEQQEAIYHDVDFGIVSLRANAFTECTLANKFFDYAALGKPFVFTELAPLRRVMARMNCAFPFRPGSPEAVAEAMRAVRAADYARFSANGLASVEREFNWKADADRLVSFLDRVAARR